jgi:hypothetical protein
MSPEFEFWEPSLVLIGRSGFSSVHPLFNVAFILATPRSETDNPVAFLRCPDGGSNAVAADLKRLLKMRGGRTEFGYVHREQVDASSGLGFERYDPRIGEASGEISAFGRRTRWGICTWSSAPGACLDRTFTKALKAPAFAS